jgi:hypothetical protein
MNNQTAFSGIEDAMKTLTIENFKKWLDIYSDPVIGRQEKRIEFPTHAVKLSRQTNFELSVEIGSNYALPKVKCLGWV